MRRGIRQKLGGFNKGGKHPKQETRRRTQKGKKCKPQERSPQGFPNRSLANGRMEKRLAQTKDAERA